MNFVPGDCGRKSRAGCWRQIQTNLLTDIETVELWELEHRRSKTVQIIIPIDCAFKYLWRAKSQSLGREKTYAKQYMAILHREFFNKFNGILTDFSNHG